MNVLIKTIWPLGVINCRSSLWSQCTNMQRPFSTILKGIRLNISLMFLYSLLDVTSRGFFLLWWGNLNRSRVHMSNWIRVLRQQKRKKQFPWSTIQLLQLVATSRSNYTFHSWHRQWLSLQFRQGYQLTVKSYQLLHTDWSTATARLLQEVNVYLVLQLLCSCSGS